MAGNAKTETKRDATFAEDVLPDLIAKPAPAPVAARPAIDECPASQAIDDGPAGPTDRDNAHLKTVHCGDQPVRGGAVEARVQQAGSAPRTWLFDQQQPRRGKGGPEHRVAALARLYRTTFGLLDGAVSHPARCQVRPT